MLLSLLPRTSKISLVGQIEQVCDIIEGNLSMEPFIHAEEVSVTYNKGKPNEFQSLKGVTVDIYPEEFTIIFGPSGCGKSTLLYSISALQKPTSGEVYIDRVAISSMNAKKQALLRQSTIGMIFQSFYLIDSLTVLDNVCLPRVFRNESKKERQKEGMRLLQRFGIGEQAERYPSQLSGGQKQRVAIARALINDPAIILADEPVGNLDSKSAENVLGILKELKEVDKKAVVLVTHDPTHLTRADRVIFLKDGELVEIKQQKPTQHPIESSEKEQKQRRGADKQEMHIDKALSKAQQTLLKSFGGMPKEYVSALLAPFKAQQTLSHILSDLSEEQVSLAEGFTKELFFGSLSFQQFELMLDRDMDAGGAGWDSRRAKSVRKRMQKILEIAQLVKKKNPHVVAVLAKHLGDRFSLRFQDREHKMFYALLDLRIRSDIGYPQVKRILDTEVKNGGVGMHRSIAGKVAREIEVIMLAAY